LPIFKNLESASDQVALKGIQNARRIIGQGPCLDADHISAETEGSPAVTGAEKRPPQNETAS
jgi:hypothetical protein